MATITAGLLACTVAFGCSKKDNARTDTAANNPAATPADTTLRGSQGGTVSGTTPITRDDSARMAHSPTPTDRADASAERRAATQPSTQPSTQPATRSSTQPSRTTSPSYNADRTTTSTGGTVTAGTPRRIDPNDTAGNVSTRTNLSARSDRADRDTDVAVRTETRAVVTPPAETPRATERSAETPEREDAARPMEGAAAVGASNNTTITAEPQVVNVVLLANIGDKERAARMCLSPTALNNQALREYVQQEIRDHQQLNDRVNQLVRSKNIIPTRSQVGDQFFQRNQDQPRADENTRDFFARETRLHQDMLTALDQQLLPSARDTELRQLLTDGKTMIQAHLTRAQQLQGTASNQTSTSLNQPTTSAAPMNTTPGNAMQPSNPPATQPTAQPNSTVTPDNRAAARPNQPATQPTYGQPQPIGQRTPTTQPTNPPAAGAATPVPPDNKPANLSPAYGETTSVNVRPPSANVTTTPNSASVTATAPSASVTTTPGAAAVAPATNPCDVAPASIQAPGAQLQMQMRPDTSRGYDSRVRADSSRTMMPRDTTVPRDTTQVKPDTTRARPTPPRP